MSPGAYVLAVAALVVGAFVIGMVLFLGGRAIALRANHRRLIARAASVRSRMRRPDSNPANSAQTPLSDCCAVCAASQVTAAG